MPESLEDAFESTFDLCPQGAGRSSGAERILRRWWLRLYGRIESLVSLDTDTETRRIQKVMVVIAAVVGAPSR